MSDIYEALNRVMTDVTTLKKRQGPQGEYFADEDIVNSLRPALVKHGVVIHPSEIEDVRQESFITEKTYQGQVQQKRMWKTTVVGKVRFAAASDGSHIDVPSIGASIDSYDSDANKAMTFFRKNAILNALMFATVDQTPADAPDNGNGFTVPKEQTVVPGMGVSVTRQWSAKDVENASRWFVECGALPPVSEGVAEAQRDHTISLLNLSPLNQGFLKAQLVEWARIYRGYRDQDLSSGEASKAATLEIRDRQAA